jgi:hypothetical protein
MEYKQKRNHRLRKTRNKTSKNADGILLGIIMAVAAILRFWDFSSLPFMHDEFSALIRTNFDNFHDLVEYGIIPDSHPAGTQLFLYFWVKLVGWSEFWVKLPFALMGLASIYLIFKIGQQWFNNKVGLLSAAFFAASQFTIFYSQLARPYSAGLFFVLLMTYFWDKILFDRKTPSFKIYIGFGLSAWAAAMMQYFSIAQAGLIFLTGLFLLPKERRKAYWLSGIGAVLLYCPNFPIFYQQLFVSGSIGGWLTSPSPTFLTDFIQYTMNYSPLFIFGFGLIIFLPILLGKRDKKHSSLRWAGIIWFLIVFVVAYTYSILREPILQQSTLIFSYPFLIIVALSMFKNNTMSIRQTYIAVIALLFIGTSTLVVNRRHYDLMYHQGYDQIAAEIGKNQKQIGETIRFATYSERTQEISHYLNAEPNTYVMQFDRYNDSTTLNDWLQSGTSEYLGFGWSDHADAKWEIAAVGSYPYLLDAETWFNSKYLLLSLTEKENSQYLLNDLSMEEPVNYWSQEWGKAFSFSGDSLESNADMFGIVAHVRALDSVKDCILVMEIKDSKTDTTVLWHGSNEMDGQFLPGDNILATGIRLSESDFTLKGKTIKTYIWNKGHGNIILDKISYYTDKRNKIISGLYEPLQ